MSVAAVPHVRDARPRVLIVDDDLGDLKAATRALGNATDFVATVLQARCLREAEETLRVASVDLIVLDLHLGDSSGADTVRRINDLAPYVPVVALTNLEDPSIGEQCIRAGAEDFLPKERVLQDLARTSAFALRRVRRVNERLHTMLAELHDALPQSSAPTHPSAAGKRLHALYRDFLAHPSELESMRRQLKALAGTLVELGTPPSAILRATLELDVGGASASDVMGAISSHFCLELMASVAEALFERSRDP